MSNLVEKALIIDDSEIDLFIQRRFLEVFNFSKQLHSYSSAKQALAWLEAQTADSLPDIVFLDLNMPDIDGFGFLDGLSKLPKVVSSKVRVVILTSSNSTTDINRALSYKIVIHFITKPLKRSDIEELKHKLVS